METVYTSLDGSINVVDYEGNSLAGWPQSLGAPCYSSPVIADLDGDNIPEIVVGANTWMLSAFYLDGSSIDLFPLELEGPVRGTPTVADISQDGTMELAVGSDGGFFVVNLKSLSENGPNWSTARGNNQRTGFYKNWVVSVDNTVVPEALSLKQNYPNPFNPTTTIEFGVPTHGPVTLTIYDVMGHEVTQLVDSEFAPGTYSFRWNGIDKNAKQVDSGLYFARINASGVEQIVKMMLLK